MAVGGGEELVKFGVSGAWGTPKLSACVLGLCSAGLVVPSAVRFLWISALASPSPGSLP